MTGIARRFRARGFTLIELMVTLGIAAILLTLAAPNLSQFQRNSQLTSATNSLVGALNAARAEAMKRGKNTFVVPTSNGNGNQWATGWVVFVDIDRSQAYEAGNDFTVLEQPALPGFITVSANGTANESPAYVMFDSSGYARPKDGSFSNMTINLSRSDLSGASQIAETRRIKIGITGRISTCKPASSSDATCPATDS
ncbi:type IV fimbrial biogenesis protein FimT [Paracidovorax konjaci]|uniref:Type II secretion system protein H n=2 Tax=Paracidovorax konjaci TaxID=32040 RepID=A0A1I1XTL0_9BURK|nr:type IV fimbrial biogenesis protein FimT [Paracidovorax konjaci]